MPAGIEWLTEGRPGILRQGTAWHCHGDPFDRALVIVGHGTLAEMKGLAVGGMTLAAQREIFAALKRAGFTEWSVDRRRPDGTFRRVAGFL